MKLEPRQQGPLHRLMAAITRNWGLKLLALALAIVVYHSLKPKSESPKDANDRHLLQYR